MFQSAGFRKRLTMIALAFALLVVAGGKVGMAQTPVSGAANLAAVKQTAIDNAATQKTATEQLLRFAGRYAVLVEGAGYDYQAMWDSNTPETAGLIAAIKGEWIKAHDAYEQNRGLIAGLPAFSKFDPLIESSSSAASDPTGALDWTLTLADGSKVVKPGNLFHDLTEPMLWGTDDSLVSLRVDLNADGTIESHEALPEAKRFLASGQELDDATADLQAALNDWQPTLPETLSALATMVPAIPGYFE